LVALLFLDCAVGSEPGEVPEPLHAAAMPATAIAAAQSPSPFHSFTFFGGSLWPCCEALARESDDSIQSIDSIN
jgi:hypothetical protein